MDGSFERPTAAAAPAAELTKGVCAGAAFLAIGQACIVHVQANERILRRSREPEALHQLRVGLRRWRAALSVFRPLLSEDGRASSSELKWLAGELNQARDLDVFELANLGDERPEGVTAEGLDALRRTVAQIRQAAYERADRAIRSERCRRLLWDSARAVRAEGLVVGVQGPPARDLARRSLARRHRRLACAGRPDKLDAARRHELRIHAKKARYTAELFAPLFGRRRRLERYAGRLKDLQDALGALNDLSVGQDLARRLAEEAGSIEAAFTAGVICGAARRREATLLEGARSAYERFETAEPFW